MKRSLQVRSEKMWAIEWCRSGREKEALTVEKVQVSFGKERVSHLASSETRWETKYPESEKVSVAR